MPDIEILPPQDDAKASPPEAVRLLERLGVHRLVVPIPFEEEGPVSCFVVENGPELGGVTLFDAAVHTEAAARFLLDALGRLGLGPQDVRRVVISHGHLDHYGNARRLDAPVLAHRADWNKIAPTPEEAAARDDLHRRLYRALGVDDARLAVLERGWQWLKTMAVAPEAGRMQPVEEGDRLAFARFEAEVLHLPGHTPGMICLWVPEAGLLFSSDHLLEHTSPNPVMEPGPSGIDDKPRSLERYLESVARTRALPVRWVAPGHGPLFDGHVAHIDRLLGFYERRQEKMVDWLIAHPGATAVEVGAALFPRALDRALFLVLSEVLGNLEVLETAGRVRRAPDADGVHRFHTV